MDHDIEDVDHVRMFDGGRDARLPQEPLPAVVIARKSVDEHLEVGDLPPEAGVLTPDRCAPCPLPDTGADPIGAEFPSPA